MDGFVVIIKNCLVLEYLVMVSVWFNYDLVFNLLIFDYFMMVGGNYDEGFVNILDGIYEVYEFVDGKWKYVEKVFYIWLDELLCLEFVL